MDVEDQEPEPDAAEPEVLLLPLLARDRSGGKRRTSRSARTSLECSYDALSSPERGGSCSRSCASTVESFSLASSDEESPSPLSHPRTRRKSRRSSLEDVYEALSSTHSAEGAIAVPAF